ncbi:MAG: zinc-dependent metalloprotease [Brumimicrobium sp.]
MRTFLFFITIILPIYLTSQEQMICGTNQIMSDSSASDFYENANSIISAHSNQNSNTKRSTLVVPVVFHVVYNTADQNIPDSLIHHQLQVLNEDFKRLNSDTVNTPLSFKSIAGAMDIDFCLAQQDPDGNPTDGIVRVATSETFFPSVTSYNVPDPIKHDSSGGSDAWNTQQYMNIWICNLSGSSGYTAPPGNFAPEDDGLVCHYEFIDKVVQGDYGKGRVIVHEMGHWFFLKHIWGDDDGACTGTDYINDTPNQAEWTGSCPTFPVIDSCSPSTPGIMFMNYMDYTIASCKNLFTEGQVDYMSNGYDALMTDYYTENKCVSTVSTDDYNSNNKIFFDGKSIVVDFENYFSSVEIYDMTGRKVHKSRLSKTHIHYFTPTRKGIYIVKVVDESQRVTFKKVACMN